VFTGLSFAEIKEQHPAEYNEFVVRSWEAVPNAERVHSLNRRALETWRHVVRSVNESPDAESGNEPIRIAVVTHGGMLQWIFKASFGAHPDSPHTWMPLVSASNCAVFEFTARPVHSRDRAGSPTRWYYGQWSRVNFTPAPESSAGSVAREQFHTDASDAR
jgi:broad specificity phosphatase PhoE